MHCFFKLHVCAQFHCSFELVDDFVCPVAHFIMCMLCYNTHSVMLFCAKLAAPPRKSNDMLDCQSQSCHSWHGTAHEHYESGLAL